MSAVNHRLWIVSDISWLGGHRLCPLPRLPVSLVQLSMRRPLNATTSFAQANYVDNSNDASLLVCRCVLEEEVAIMAVASVAAALAAEAMVAVAGTGRTQLYAN